ncbi:MAG: hypothetical protein ACRD30_02785, partial [Bryobacteraceae bacterium]
MGRTSESTGPASAKSQKARTRLRAAVFDDYPQIAQIESLRGLEPKSYDEWSQLWLGNPAYRERSASWPIGWVIEDSQGRIAGSLGNIPLAYEFEGRRILAAAARGLVAEPAFSSGCPLLLDQFLHQPGVELCIHHNGVPEATPSSESDCARVTSGAWDEAGFWVTGHRVFAESYLKKRRRSFAKPLSYPLGSLMR